jgi:hypothetical protein
MLASMALDDMLAEGVFASNEWVGDCRDFVRHSGNMQATIQSSLTNGCVQA